MDLSTQPHGCLRHPCELADDGPVRIYEPEIPIGGLRIQLRARDLGAVEGEDRAGLRHREPSVSLWRFDPSDPNHQMWGWIL